MVLPVFLKFIVISFELCFGTQDSDPDREKPPSPTVLPSVRLRSTGLADSLRSPTNGFPKGSSGEGPKSPVLKSVTKEVGGSRTNSDTGEGLVTAPES